MNTFSQFIRGLFSHDLLVELSEKKIVIRMMGKVGKEFILEYEPYLAIETIGKKVSSNVLVLKQNINQGSTLT
ncbi:hypothetical protein [Vibrio tritonius]|uniref:hypothetical protein n=1 Tax=Vibrio tritonius TaxID=1435069 RepID=UPI000AF0CBE1|nr:hypothetical protein [Vibrio tritonius]